MVTNDVQPLADEQAPPVYTLLLNPQGRLLHDFFLFRAPGMQGSAVPAASHCMPDTTTGVQLWQSVHAGPETVLLADIHQGQQADLLQLLRRCC